ncbi:MAG: hypothetical protein QF437_04810, partial [Planctomycetota bacterium]|nr:hypothetical protein [Planctomycetota bacterium]
HPVSSIEHHYRSPGASRIRTHTSRSPKQHRPSKPTLTHYSLLITHYSLLITHYSLLITHYSLR